MHINNNINYYNYALKHEPKAAAAATEEKDEEEENGNE